MQGANHESVSRRVLVYIVSCSPVRDPLLAPLEAVSGKYLAVDLDIHLTHFYACKWLLVMPCCWNGQPYDPENPTAHMRYPK